MSTRLAVLTSCKRQVGTCVEASWAIYEPSSLLGKAVIFPLGGSNQFLWQARQKAEAYRKGGATGKASDIYHLLKLQVWREARMKKGRKRKRPFYKILSIICGSKEWNHFISLFNGDEGKGRSSALPEMHRVHPRLLASWRLAWAWDHTHGKDSRIGVPWLTFMPLG